CVGQCSGYVASILVDARWDSTQWHVWTTLLLERALATINHAGAIQEGLPVVDQLAGRRENLACWTGVSVALLVKREVFPTEGSVLAIRLVDHRDVGCDLLVLDQPVEGRSRTIGRISRKPRRLNVEALLSTLDHDLRRADFGLTDRARRLDIHDDARLHVD